MEAISNCFVALGLGLTVLQIRESRKNRTTDFEDRIDREYRKICEGLPYEALLRLPISDDQLQKHFTRFVNYFDLSNDEILFRKSGRISLEAWIQWQDGIRQNLEFPAFDAAWRKVKAISKDRFRELRKLEEMKFSTDPKHWRDD